jgi:hypothetical protein
MAGAQFLLEGALVLLLAVTLFHAVRLERALGVLKRDRAVLEDLVAGFNESTRAAEAGIERLRGATDGAGRQIARQIDQSQRLKDDLGFLTERGDRLAERLEGAVRSARMYADQQSINPSPAASAPVVATSAPSHTPPQTPSQTPSHAPEPAPVPPPNYAAAEPPSGPRLRSEAERELLRALRAAR